MGIGLVSLQTSQKREQSGPPFVSTSADNGLSVDGVSGRIVLGNDAADPAQPAQLLSNREIVTEDAIGNRFGITLRTILNALTTYLDGTRIIITGGVNTTPFMNITGGNNSLPTITLLSGDNGVSSLNLYSGSPGRSALQISTGNDSFELRADDSGFFKILASGLTVGAIDVNNSRWWFGPGGTLTFSGATVSIAGTITYRRFVSSKGAGAYNVDRDLDSGKLFTNSAANTFNLPDMSVTNRSGFIFRLAINNAGGSTVQAAAGQTIRFGSLSTSVSGALVSTDVGATVVLIWTGSVWVTESFLGAWTLT